MNTKDHSLQLANDERQLLSPKGNRVHSIIWVDLMVIISTYGQQLNVKHYMLFNFWLWRMWGSLCGSGNASAKQLWCISRLPQQSGSVLRRKLEKSSEAYHGYQKERIISIVLSKYNATCWTKVEQFRFLRQNVPILQPFKWKSSDRGAQRQSRGLQVGIK